MDVQRKCSSRACAYFALLYLVEHSYKEQASEESKEAFKEKEQQPEGRALTVTSPAKECLTAVPRGQYKSMMTAG